MRRGRRSGRDGRGREISGLTFSARPEGHGLLRGLAGWGGGEWQGQGAVTRGGSGAGKKSHLQDESPTKGKPRVVMWEERDRP